MKDIARELLKLAKELTAADELPSERELRKFYDYVMDFYGRSGLYPITKNGRPLHKRDVVKATWKMLKGRYEWGGGDSVDRERVRDIMLDAGYEWPEAPLKLAKELTAADFDVRAAKRDISRALDTAIKTVNSHRIDAMTGEDDDYEMPEGILGEIEEKLEEVDKLVRTLR